MLKRTIESHNIKLHFTPAPWLISSCFVSLSHKHEAEKTQLNTMCSDTQLKPKPCVRKQSPISAWLQSCRPVFWGHQWSSRHPPISCAWAHSTFKECHFQAHWHAHHITQTAPMRVQRNMENFNNRGEGREGKKFQNRNVLFYRIQNGKLLWGPAGSPTMNKNFIYWPRVKLYESSLSFFHAMPKETSF